MRRLAFRGYKLEDQMSEDRFKDDSKEYSKQGWKLRTIYNAEDLKLIGKPYASGSLLELRDGTLREIHESFVLHYGEDPEKLSNQPWFGKVVVLKDGTILNIDTEQAIQKVDASEFESITPLNEVYVDCFCHDWSAFDVIGAIDESYHAIIREGIVVLTSSKYIERHYDADNKLVLTPYRSSQMTEADLDKRFEKVSAEQKFKEALEAMKKVGISKEEIDKMTQYYQSYDEAEKE